MLQTLSYSSKDETNNYHQNQANMKMNQNTNSISNNQNANAANVTTNEIAAAAAELGASNTMAKKSPLDQLISNLKNNPNYIKEITLGKIINFYRIGSEIGTGNFSQVKLGLHLLTKDKVAIKILDKTKLDDKTQRLLLREISSMERLHHPNIIRLYEVIHRPTRLYICMEWAPEGELYTRIVEHGKINEVESRYIFSQIISAVNHMHKNNIIHRDIKAENIFFSNLSPFMVKVGDFGFSINTSASQRLDTYCGSPPYAAPELFRDDSYLGIYVDIWALGILLYFMVTSQMPFRADTVSKLKRMILNGDYTIPAYLSDSCQLLIKGILKPVATDRFNIKEIMESAWLDGEEFTLDLDSYQISNNIEKSLVKREESKAKEYLELIGITRDILICCNLPVAPDNTHPQQDYSFNIVNTNNSNVVDKNINLLPIPIVPNGSISFHSALLINQAKNINIELKQSINGTYRIIFHKIQKEYRREYSNDHLKYNNSSIKYTHNNAYNNNNNNNNNNKAKETNTTTNGHAPNGYIYDYNKTTNETGSYYDNNSNDFEPNNNGGGGIGSKKNSISSETHKNIFVKLNNNEVNKQIFINSNTTNNSNNSSNNKNLNNKSTIISNEKAILQMPPSHQAKSNYDENENKIVYQTNRLSLKNNRNKDALANGYKRQSSYQITDSNTNNLNIFSSKNSKSSNNYYEKQQSSKFCTIL